MFREERFSREFRHILDDPNLGGLKIEFVRDMPTHD